MASRSLDAVVIGSWPNGLTVTVARPGLGVRVYEAADKSVEALVLRS